MYFGYSNKKSKLLNFCFLTYSGLYHTDRLGELSGMKEWGTDRTGPGPWEAIPGLFCYSIITSNRSNSTAAGQMYLGLAAVKSGLF